MWKSNVQNISLYIPRWPAGVELNHVVLQGPGSEEFPDCAIIYRVSTQPVVGAAKHHRTHTWQQCSVTTSEDIVTTKYGFNLRFHHKALITTRILWLDQQADTLLKWHTLVPSPMPPQPPWHEIKGAGETVWMLQSQLRQVTTVWQNPGTWWRLPDVHCTKNSATLFRPLPNVGMQNFGVWGMYNLAKAYRSIKNPLPIAESRTAREASNGHT